MAQFVNRVRGIGVDGPVFAASLSLNVLGLLMPLAILLIFDRVIPFQSVETLTMITVVLLVSASFEFALRWARSTLLSASAADAALQNHQTFLERVLGANTVAFSQQSRAAQLERYGAISRLRDHFSGQNQALSIDLPFTAVFVCMVGLIGGWLILVPITALVCVMIFAMFMKRAQSTIFGARKKLDERRYAFLSEVLGSMETVKANTMERQMTRRFELLQTQTVDSSHRLISFAGLAQTFGAVFAQMTVAGMGLAGAFLVVKDMIGIAELAACMMLNGRIVQPLIKLMTLWVQSESVALSRSKLADIEALPQQNLRATSALPFSGCVEFVDVQIAHSESQLPFVDQLSATLESGEIALLDAGTSNATAVNELFAVVTGQRSPDSGTVLLDGHKAVERVLNRGRGGLVCLEADPAIFHGTLLDNISGFGDSEQIELAVAIASQLGLEMRVNRLPKGYGTELSTGGLFEQDPVNRQLIALVRAFAQRPKLLLMNEPTAVLDQAEREALKAYVNGSPNTPTILMASPDPRMKSLANQTLALRHANHADIEAWSEDAAQDRGMQKTGTAA